MLWGLLCKKYSLNNLPLVTSTWFFKNEIWLTQQKKLRQFSYSKLQCYLQVYLLTTYSLYNSMNMKYHAPKKEILPKYLGIFTMYLSISQMMWRSTGQFLNVVVPIWQKFYDIPRFRKWKGKPRFFACTKTLEGNAIMWLMSKFLERKKLLEPLLAINPSPAVSGKKEFAPKNRRSFSQS